MLSAFPRHAQAGARRNAAAIANFLRLRAGVVMAVQSWLGESSDSKRKSSTPGYLGVFLASKSPMLRTLLLPEAVANLVSSAVMALGVTYMPLFVPNMADPAGTGTEAPAPVPPS